MRPIAQHVLKRFELYLAIGAAVFVGVVYLLFARDADTGITVAVTVIGMGLTQAAIQWADRERSVRLRQRQIHEIREMLRDQVLNQLATIKMWMSEKPDSRDLATLFEEVDASIDEIAEAIDHLSEQQLNTWKLTYANAADHIEMPDAPLAAMRSLPSSIPGAPLKAPAPAPEDRPAERAPVAEPAVDAPRVAMWN